MRMRYLAERALCSDGWHDNVLIEFDARGLVSAVDPAVRGAAEPLLGALLPGMPNAHSHAFQRAIGAKVQRRPAGASSFWSWRNEMYALAGTLQPDEYEAAAFATFSQMRRAGYTAVAEFHYIHATPEGRPYGNLSEMSDRLISAARRAGLAIALLPALYLHAGFGELPLRDEQRRFSLGLDGYLELWRTLHTAYGGEPDVRIGFAAHSLRAVTAAELRRALETIHAIDPAAPVHIHIAEQMREVEECIAAHGLAPIAHLFDNVEIDERWCLVHATHPSEDELAAIAGAGAVVALCPTTEADLGDGIFPAKTFLEMGGRIAIGSDSNVRIDLAEELRLLEYGQRLTLQQRTVLCSDAIPSVGEYLYRHALAGGLRALGFAAESKQGGWFAGALALPLAHGSGAQACDAFVFAAESGSLPAILP
jgi:formimidoylglutamate deiminase